MTKKVVVTEFVRSQLREYYSYYATVAGDKVAARVIDGILSRLGTLAENPKMGQVEELLEGYSEGYRYLVEGNYKIIYWEAQENVIVELVFDCRQNPVKIKKFR